MSHVFFVEHMLEPYMGILDFVKHMIVLIQEWEACEIKMETGLNVELVVGEYAILGSVWHLCSWHVWCSQNMRLFVLIV